MQVLLLDLTLMEARREGMQWGKQPPPALVHLVDRSSQLSGADDVAATGTRFPLV